MLMQDQIAHNVAERFSQNSSAEAVHKIEPLVRAPSYNTAPITGISCSLIDELPTMALPMPEMMLGPAAEGFHQDCPDFLI